MRYDLIEISRQLDEAAAHIRSLNVNNTEVVNKQSAAQTCMRIAGYLRKVTSLVTETKHFIEVPDDK